DRDLVSSRRIAAMLEEVLGMLSVKAWTNGSHRQSGAGYGLKLSKADRDKWVRRNWRVVTLHPLGGAPFTVSIDNDSFWNETCREIPHRAIGSWLVARGLAPWPKGQPPEVSLIPRGAAAFDLR